MTDHENIKLMEIAEAVTIVQGLRLLISRINVEYSDYPDQNLYRSTIGYVKSIELKFSAVASRKVKTDQDGKIVSLMFTEDQLIRSSALDYINQSLN